MNGYIDILSTCKERGLCTVFAVNPQGERPCGLLLRTLPDGKITISRPQPSNDYSGTCHDDPVNPRRMPFFEVGICLLRELKRVAANEELVCEKMWGWGSERMVLQDMYAANGFEPIDEVSTEGSEGLNKGIREINERLRTGLGGYTIELTFDTETEVEMRTFVHAD